MTSTAAYVDADELELLLGELLQLEHQDFRGYARSSLRRCVTRAQETQGGVTLAAQRARVSFAEHSLATDAAFAEVQLVSCRNVLIYFGGVLRERALGIFHDALCPGGLLGLGAQETLAPVGAAPRFVPFAEAARLDRRR